MVEHSTSLNSTYILRNKGTRRHLKIHKAIQNVLFLKNDKPIKFKGLI